jgi:peptide/nickel transport system ATP-binding protein
VEFFTRSGVVTAVDGVSFAIAKGEILGLVGESGCGKTVLSLSLLKLIDKTGRISAGEIVYKGIDFIPLDEDQMRPYRGKEISMIFQNPTSSLNPVRRIGVQLASVVQLHFNVSRKEALDQAEHWLNEVQVADPSRIMRAYPHELSGGTCQRIMIAMALSCQPSLLIADEPTASLDVTIQAQIMTLLLSLRDRHGMAILLISHDLGVVSHLCDRMAVMYLGRIVETGTAAEVCQSPLHPYTRALLDCVPTMGQPQRIHYQVLRGEMPSPLAIPRNACRFESRCPEALSICSRQDPKLLPATGQREVACLLRDEAGGRKY